VEDVTKRVLMFSHGITAVTGFANQLWLQSRALVEEGYEVYVLHRDYRGEPIVFPRGCDVATMGGRALDGITLLPVGREQWGQDVFPYYISKFRPDYVHTLGDIWCHQQIPEIQSKTRGDFKWLAHYVFDTENVVGFWHNSIRNTDIAIVPSKNSYDMLKHSKHDNVKYIPHGINVNVFKPAIYEEKMEIRKQLKIPEKVFVILMVAHNQYRKMVNRLVDAFEIFHKNNRDSLMVLHCLPKDVTGWDLPQIISDKGLGGSIIFTDKAGKGIGDIHVKEEVMRKLYCMADVHALSTGGEGFGIPLVEAMACGIPNVTTHYTTGEEFLAEKKEDGQIVNDRGMLIPYVDLEEHHTGGFWAKIDRAKMAEAFQYLKNNPDEAKQMGMKARKFAVENYDMNKVKEQWKRLYNNFDDIVEEFRDIVHRKVEEQDIKLIRVA